MKGVIQPPRGPRSPTYTPGKPQTKSAAEASGPNTAALLSWWGLALDRCLRCVWSEGKGS